MPPKSNRDKYNPTLATIGGVTAAVGMGVAAATATAGLINRGISTIAAGIQNITAPANSTIVATAENARLMENSVGNPMDPNFVGPPAPGLGANPQEAQRQVSAYGQSSGELIDILKPSGGKKSKQESEILYLVSIQFEGNNQNWWEDTLFFAVYRIGFLKSFPIYKLRINLTPIVLNQVRNDINDKKNPKLTMKLSTLQTIEGEKTVGGIFEKKYLVASINAVTQEEITRGTSVMCDMVLVHPVLFDMSTRYSFNKEFKNKTAFEILEEYEKYLDKTYGANFESKHITNKKNEYKYSQLITQPSNQKTEFVNQEQIQLLALNDAAIPTFLQFKYKIDHIFGMYFFDDFNIKSKKEIVRYFLTFYDKEKFEKMDTSKYQDIVEKIQMGKTHSLVDYFSVLDKEDPVISYRDTHGRFLTAKKQKWNAPQATTQIKKEVEIVKGRTHQDMKVDYKSQQQSQSGAHLTLIVPDSKDNTDERLKLTKETLKKKVDCLDEFSVDGCGPEWVQFGTLYSLNPKKSDQFFYTPLAIINTFHRVHQKEMQLSHSCRFTMLKFKDEEKEEKKESSSPAATTQKMGDPAPARQPEERLPEEKDKPGPVETGGAKDPQTVPTSQQTEPPRQPPPEVAEPATKRDFMDIHDDKVSDRDGYWSTL